MATFTVGSNAEQRKIQGGFDPWLLVSAVVLIGFGLLAIYSQGFGREGGGVFKKQLFNVVAGLVPFAIFALVHPKTWIKLVNPIYIVNLLLLASVHLFGKSTKGAERWINIGGFQFQPSELSKILIILTLCSFFAVRRDEINKLSTFLLSFLHVAVPAALIITQPHLGATLVVIFTWLAVSLISGVPTKYITGFIACFAIIIGLVFAVPPVRKVLIKDYQWKRVEGLVGKGKDVKGANYQTEQSKIAFALGGVTGVGFKNGERKAGGFIPEQHSDFVFSIIGEEFGLVGCTMVLGFFALLFGRCWLGVLGDYEVYYQTLSAGVLTVLAFHMVANMAMVLELIPVVGLWLPFLSYGGTAMWLCMSLVGLMLNIRSREKSVLFSVQN